MRRLMMLAFLFALPSVAGAQNAAWSEDTITWQLPTSRTDGTPLAVSELAVTEIEVRDGPSGQVLQTLSVDIPGVTEVYPRSEPFTGTLCYVARVVDTGGLQSDWSNEVCRTVNAKPNRPQLLEVK